MLQHSLRILRYIKRCLTVIAGGVIVIARLLFRKKKKMIYLFGSPGHSNLGDQAQTYCIQHWCCKNLPEYGLFIFRLAISRNIILLFLRKIIGKDDILFCHSGYHLTDLYDEKKVYYKIIELFPDYPITIFPQTIQFIDKGEEERCSRIFEKHSDLTLLCRDEVSYKNAKRMFKYTTLLLYPDVVTMLIGDYSFSNVRNGVLLCKRNDKESFYTHEQIDVLIKRLSDISKVEITDTTIPVSYKHIAKRRKEVLEDIFDEYSKYQVIITDRYHGTIFSLIAGTPVIVLQSTDHKLSSGVDWFPKDLFGDYITAAENLDIAFNLALDRIKRPVNKEIPKYFQEKYYDILFEKLSFGKK